VRALLHKVLGDLEEVLEALRHVVIIDVGSGSWVSRKRRERR
jgi:hypothetical protein